ncbi:MAG: GTP cyclohydrolase I FolE [Armatimonadetes bacterium]|jgi:GTP cyclohydrolase I|nr:GTP cyclohydrolase I FolE [Armatimonadota bacterium]
MNQERIAELVRQLLIELGEDPNREGLQDTPKRVAAAYEFMLKGYKQTIEEVINGAIFTHSTNNMVVVRDIEVYSICEHHMLPFFGRCHIGYISKDKVLGVSKLARIVDCYARRLQIQERLTQQIARAIKSFVDCEGVGVVIEAQHLCMMMRGVEKQNSMMTTSSVLGSFHESVSTRTEFMTLISKER